MSGKTNGKSLMIEFLFSKNLMEAEKMTEELRPTPILKGKSAKRFYKEII